jgi:hypothetical protein
LDSSPPLQACRKARPPSGSASHEETLIGGRNLSLAACPQATVHLFRESAGLVDNLRPDASNIFRQNESGSAFCPQMSANLNQNAGFPFQGKSGRPIFM